jgi:DNA-binding transcriptional ArsR family regulator
MPTPEAIPDDVLNLMAGKFRMLSDPSRLAILRSLMVGGETSVGEVVEKTGRALANVSKHLKQLAEAGLVARRKEGLQVFYRLDDPVIEKICHLVCDSIYQDIEEEMERQRKLLRGKKKPD